MLGSFDYVVWLLGSVLELAVVVCAIRRKSFRRYLCLNLYMLLSFFVSIGRYEVLAKYSLTSPQYRYFYYYSDALLTVFLYLALITLYLHVFDEMKVESYLRLVAVLLLTGTAVFSYLVVQQSSGRIATRFAYEMSQNLYFVGLVLTYLLWGAILRLRETRTRLIQLVLSMGIYFSAFAATFALQNMFAQFHMGTYIVPIVGCLLPLAWVYSFVRIDENARIAPARLAVVPR